MDAASQFGAVAACMFGLFAERFKYLESPPYVLTRAASTISFAAGLYSCPSDRIVFHQTDHVDFHWVVALWAMRAFLICADVFASARLFHIIEFGTTSYFGAHKTLAITKVMMTTISTIGVGMMMSRHQVADAVRLEEHTIWACNHVRTIALPCMITSMCCIDSRRARMAASTRSRT